MTVVEPSASDLGEEVTSIVRRLGPGERFCLERPITVEEFCGWLGSDVRAELVHGVIQMSPPPTDAHEECQGWLFRLLGTYVEERQLGRLRGSRSGVQVGPTTLREPDIAFFRTEHLDRISPTGRHGAPDFVVEIVDSAQAREDAVTKQAQYEEIGVEELWVVDLPRRKLRCFLLAEGRFRRLPVDASGEVEARTVPGFRLQVSWFFQGPDFPRTLDVLRSLLGG